MPPAAYWSRPAAELLATLDSRVQGLTAGEAAERLRLHGPNTTATDNGDSAWRIGLRQLSDPLVLLLLFAVVLSLVLQDWSDAAIVASIVVASALLGFSQEWRASRAMDRLRERLALNARVLRDGELRSVPSSRVVPGDVIELSAGNLVPGDAVLLEARDLLVSESTLTGESFPVEKGPGQAPPEAALAARLNCVHAGTSVRSGTARALVVHTGRATELGRLSGRLLVRRPETAFAAGLRRFGHLLLRLMFAIVLAVLAVNVMLDRPLPDALLFAVALAVGLSPELLPAIVSVTLSHGARAMARHGVLVRRLDAIENLGAIDVLCTDKTGTLTQGNTVLHAALDADGRASDAVRHLGFLNASFETGIENPLDAALVEAARAEGFSAEGWRKVDEIPYDFLRKRVSIVLAREDVPGRCRFVTKGALAPLLARCSRVALAAGTAAMDDAVRARLDAQQRDLASQGLRVLAVATRDVDARSRYEPADEDGMCLQGLLAFRDPPKPDAAKLLEELAGLGIAVKVISGDSRHAVAHLAREVGLDPASMLTGAEVAALKDEALWQRAEGTQLFVEVDPQQKERIVRALHRRGHAVGYLGDGINDVPALHAADVGISVEGAADAARESADVVLLRPGLGEVRDGVLLGRRSFSNTLKYIAITTSANFGNMVSMAAATLFLPFLPLLAKQILLNNLLSDIPSMAIAGDRVDDVALRRPQHWDLRAVQRFMIVFGLVSTAFDLLTFALLRVVFDVDEPTFHTAWFVVSLLTELAVVLLLRTSGPALASRPAPLVLAATVAVAVVTMALPHAGPAAAAMGFVPLALPLAAAMVGVVLAYAAATEWVKRVSGVQVSR